MLMEGDVRTIEPYHKHRVLLVGFSGVGFSNDYAERKNFHEP